jgi:hypothetical protein
MLLCCELCNEEAVKFDVWIDRKMDMQKGNEFEYSETLKLCEQHATQLLDTLLKHKDIKDSRSIPRVLSIIGRKTNDKTSSNPSFYSK